MDNNVLAHYGILGMHWGRKKSTTSTSTPTTNHNTSADHDKKMELKNKKLHEMSNDELRTYTQRMALERQYKELSKVQVSAGKKFVTDLIANQAKSAVNQYASAYTKKIVEDLLKKTMKTASNG
jgi:hypothetical protein